MFTTKKRFPLRWEASFSSITNGENLLLKKIKASGIRIDNDQWTLWHIISLVRRKSPVQSSSDYLQALLNFVWKYFVHFICVLWGYPPKAGAWTLVITSDLLVFRLVIVAASPTTAPETATSSTGISIAHICRGVIVFPTSISILIEPISWNVTCEE